MVNNANGNPVSTNIRIKIETKKELESLASKYKETHDEIVARLIRLFKTGSIDKEAEKPGWATKV